MLKQQTLAFTFVMGLTACAQTTGGPPSANHLANRPDAGSSNYQTQQIVRQLPYTRRAPWLRRRGAEPFTLWQTAVEDELLRLTNEERSRAGLQPVTLDTRLRSMARLHSLDQSARNYFSHESPENRTVMDRLSDANISWSWEGENIRWVSSRDVSGVARDMMYEPTTGWMNSPGHRANILNQNFTLVGIGVFKNTSDGRFIATQDFIQPS